MSGIGKGVSTSSIGLILKSKGFNVTALKIDPYINVDAGTMNPTEHGEVFVLKDGYETDQDMGNYERFLNEDFPELNYMTTGRVYQEVIRRERNLEYKGKNVEVVPDIPLEVIRRIKKAGEVANADVCLIEIGGTIGEYQNIIFLEAARMMKQEAPRDVAVVMVSYVPIPGSIGEMKTKPTQYAARTLNNAGLQADVILARAAAPIDAKRKEKIATFCNIRPEHVISAPDVKSIYDIPLNFEKDGLGDILSDILGLPQKKSDLSKWSAFVKRSKNGKREITIAIAGKYFKSGEYVLSDVYISVIEALKSSAYSLGVKLNLDFVDTKDAAAHDKTSDGWTGARLKELAKYDGILVPGGFGESGIEGKIRIIEYARKNKIPYFGLCYGMQLAVIEYARNVVGLTGAHTREVNPKAPDLVIDFMPEQEGNVAKANYGGTMRLGEYPCSLKPGSVADGAYAASPSSKLKAKSSHLIYERHRHRYEVNPAYIKQLEDAGLVFSGVSPTDKRIMEIAELPKKEHPFFLGTQFHPEFLARPLSPHPLFTAFLKAADTRAKGKR